MKAARPEYADHKQSLDEFHQQALKAKPASAGHLNPGAGREAFSGGATYHGSRA